MRARDCLPMRIGQALSLLFLVVWRPVLGQSDRNTCEMGGKNSGNECQTAADLQRLYVADEEAVLAVLRDSPHVASATAAELNPLITKAVKNGHARVLVKLVIRYVIDNGGDEADPNSRATPEALAERVALVDEFERAEAAFAPGDRVVVDGLRAKTKYNGKTGVVRGPLGANGRFPVAVNMTQGVETIALKVANLRAADE